MKDVFMEDRVRLAILSLSLIDNKILSKLANLEPLVTPLGQSQWRVSWRCF